MAQVRKIDNNAQINKVMEELGAEDLDTSKLKNIGIGLIVGIVAVTVLLTVLFKWWGLLAGVAISLIALAVFYKQVSEKQKKMVMAYKTLGMTKEEYAQSFDMAGVNAAQKKFLVDLWEKTPEPEKVINLKGKPQKVGESKQNKKKKKYKKKK